MGNFSVQAYNYTFFRVKEVSWNYNISINVSLKTQDIYIYIYIYIYIVKKKLHEDALEMKIN